jgi:hypothetical protein
VRVSIGVEDVDHGEFADRENHAIAGLRARELIQIRLELLQFAAEIDRLAEEGTLHQPIGMCLADLVGLAARITRDTEGIAEAEALIDFRI